MYLSRVVLTLGKLLVYRLQEGVAINADTAVLLPVNVRKHLQKLTCRFVLLVLNVSHALAPCLQLGVYATHGFLHFLADACRKCCADGM